MRVEGRAWVFGDHINTDAMYPHDSFQATPEKRKELCLASVRPGWGSEVRVGDVLVGGLNFGTGSGRPAPQVLHSLGIRAVVAETVAGLFYRGCVNAALPVADCAGVSSTVCDGDVVALDVAEGLFTNLTTGAALRFLPMPSLLVDIIASGGVINQLRKRGYLEEAQD